MSVTAAGAVTAERDYASWGARLGAYLIDSVVVFVGSFVLGLVLGIAGAVLSGGAASGVEFLAIIAAIVFILGYFIRGNGQGQTFGKKAVGIKVVSDDTGEPIGYVKAFLRLLTQSLLAVLFYIPSIIDYLMPLWDSKKQSIHDKAVGSVVVKA